jgi:hypothetical protein
MYGTRYVFGILHTYIPNPIPHHFYTACMVLDSTVPGIAVTLEFMPAVSLLTKIIDKRFMR